jgi:hypothetical protein
MMTQSTSILKQSRASGLS